MAVTEAEIRDALTWESQSTPPEDKNTWEWLWEAIQGDFNDDRSGGQIAMDAAVSMIPGIDQICDVRDIIANCKAIAQAEKETDNTWLYVSLALTLIGLFPTLGSLVKGVLKLFFVFIRRYGLDHVTKAVDEGMSWVVAWLRKRDVQRYISEKRIDEVFKWLADQIRTLKGQVNARALLANFDRGIAVMKGLLGKVTWLPGGIGTRAQATIELVQRVRKGADAPLEKAMAPVRHILDATIHRLEIESLIYRRGIVDVNNIHFRGALPETRAVTLMRDREPPPKWLSKGRQGAFPGLNPRDADILEKIQRKKAEGWPDATGNITSFHKMEAVEIAGPAKLYRVVSPSNGAMSDCWIDEAVWKKIQSAPDPKAAWRKYCAVWPDWNPNGQFVVMEVPAGQTLKVWKGPAASQAKLDDVDLDAHLEGGWDQIVIRPQGPEYDNTRIYKLGGGKGTRLKRTDMSYAEYNSLPAEQKARYTPMREKINHPNIRGPLDTGWGYTDFDAQVNDGRIGLPTLPGQTVN